MARVMRWVPKQVDSFDGNPSQGELTEGYTAITDGSGDDGVIAILDYPECPEYFERHPKDPNLFVVNIAVGRIPDVPQAFNVTIKYSNKYTADGSSNQQGSQFKWIQNPLQRPALIDWDTYTTREVIEYALDESDKPKVPVITQAGEPLLLEEEVERRVITVEKNVPAVKDIFAKTANFINKDNVRIGGINFEPDTLWLTKLKVSPVKIENNIPHYVLSYKLYHREETWIRMLRHAGYYYREVKDNGKLGPRVFPILINNTFPSKPVPLNPDGSIDRRLAIFLGIYTLINIPQVIRDNILSPAELQEIWEKAKIYFRTKKRITFSGNIPYR